MDPSGGRITLPVHNVQVDDEHACRIEQRIYQLDFAYRVICRCGFKGSWRRSQEAALEDRLSHKRSVDIPQWPAR